MSAARRTARDARDARRRRLGQNFLPFELADRLVETCGFRSGDLVVEIGPGHGAFTTALARRGVRVLAVELDPALAARLRAGIGHSARELVRVVEADFLTVRLPERPFRVIGSLPFGRTTDLLRRLFDDPSRALVRADLIVQWEVACKRADVPPRALLSAAWAPWWEFQLGERIPAREFRPVPSVDAGWLRVVRRSPPLLPPSLAPVYARFLRAHWPPRPSAPVRAR